MLHLRPGRGFTLIELLVVMVIVAIIVGILLPALGRARGVARVGQCLSQLHQIGVANTIYQDDNNDQMPIIKPPKGVSSYTHGGRQAVAASKVDFRFLAHPKDRPLNSYVHPNADLGKKLSRSDPELRDPEKFNLPIFQCPSDRSFNYQEEGGGLHKGLSAYYAVGTSYTFNASWSSFRITIPIPVRKLSWAEGVKMFQRARLVYPSRFVAFFEDPADYKYWYFEDVPLTHHGTPEVHSVLALDGHGALAELNFMKPVTPRYAIFFPEQLR